MGKSIPCFHLSLIGFSSARVHLMSIFYDKYLDDV